MRLEFYFRQGGWLEALRPGDDDFQRYSRPAFLKNFSECEISGLRVVDARGLRLSFAQVALRNLLRFVDGLPVVYLVGGVAALLNRRAQRLGDLAADTLVVWEPPEPEPDFAALRGDKYNSLRAHAPAVARLRQALSPAEARAVWSAVARREQFDAGARVRLFADMAVFLRKIAAAPPEAAEGMTDEQFVRNVVDVLYVNR
ncbi:MAG: hypothetical protein EXS37_22085 [Opitutus sp.]|nr:hypothetical protein [Opitutus sp.]